MSNRAVPVSRRTFIQAGLATGTGFLVAACSGGAAGAPTTTSKPTNAPASSATTAATSPTVAATAQAAAAPTPAGVSPAPTLVGASASGKNSAALPSYIPANLAAKPDYDARDPRVTLAWDNYPKNSPVSWNKAAPGTGSRVNAFAVDYYPPPAPYDSNATWQAVNKALNSDFQMTQVSGPDYSLRMATMMAGNDVPDIIHLFT